MHVTACLAGQKEDVEVGEDCRTLQALKEAVVKALPQLCVEGFDVSVGGRALDNDEGVVSLNVSACLDVVPNTRVLSLRALREAGHVVSKWGLLDAADNGNVALCTLYLDAGMPVDGEDYDGITPLHLACDNGHLSLATLLLDRGSTAIDEKNNQGETPLHVACDYGHVSLATLLLDRGSRAIDEKNDHGDTPLHLSCELSVATLLLDRGSRAIDDKNGDGDTPLHLACSTGNSPGVTLLLDRGSRAIDERNGRGDTPLHVACRAGDWMLVTLLLDRGCDFDFEEYKARGYRHEVLRLLSERRRTVQAGTDDASLERA